MSQRSEPGSALTVRIPLSSRQPAEQEHQWYFQKIGNRVLETETQLYFYVNQHKLLLTCSYLLLFLCSISRIVLYIYLLSRDFSSFELKDQVIVVSECVLSALSFFHYVFRFVARLRGYLSDDSDFNSLMYILFCTKFFSLSYWVVALLVESSETKYCIAIVVLLVAYLFLTEKSPGLLIIIIYTILMCFLLECLVRGLMCRYKTPWRCCEGKYEDVEIPVQTYSKSECVQKVCGICLKEYTSSEAVCQLSCHPTHLFHFKCLKEWITQHYTCPYCRNIIAAAN